MECESTQSEMVATLQSRKEALESKLREKNAELKTLCIQEAELTGVLPPEIPLEPGESPPVFRRRVGTVFTYPENLINKLKSKEEESLATLELECKIQTGIAEAALSLANDAAVNKCVRRKHLLVYQQSQRRLMELEARLNLLRHSARGSQLKQRKKPRPPLEAEGDWLDGTLQEGINLSPLRSTNSHGHLHPHQPLSLSIGDRGPLMRHSHTYNGFSRSHDVSNTLPLNTYNHRQSTQSAINISSRQYMGHQHQPVYNDDRITRSGTTGHVDRDQHGYWLNENLWYNTAPAARYHGTSNQIEEERDRPSRYRDRFGSLDRHRSGNSSSGGSNVMEGGDLEPQQGSPIHRFYTPPSPCVHSVLLPNQTYPENSLMRTQSLGTVDHSNTVGRKCQEKEWFETSLDAGPRPPSSPQQPLPHPLPPPPPLPPPHFSYSEPEQTLLTENNPSSATQQQLSFDTVVPFEIPKNHTVIQAGKWQPYREVTKPFEMSDFYKYSTKFRKNTTSAPVSPQQKAIYQPLQPMTCQPLNMQTSSSSVSSTKRESIKSDEDLNLNHQALQESYPHEVLAWYQDQNLNQPRTATLL